MPGFRRMIKYSILVTTWFLIFSTGLFAASLEPGYLDFDNLPDTNFTCVGKVIGGYYADLETNCQMFHVCTIGQLDEPMDIRFLCLNGTVFDQETRVCERIDEVDCSKSERFYSLNLELYGNTQPPILEESAETEDPIVEKVIPSTSSTTTTTPRTIQTSTARTTTTTTTKQPQFYSSIRPITHIPYHKGHSHFSIGNQQQHPSPFASPEEINLNLNSGGRTKPFPSHYHHYSDNINNNNKKLVNKFNEQNSGRINSNNIRIASSSTTENGDSANNFKNNVQSSPRPSPNYHYNFNYHDIDSEEDYDNAPRPQHNYQYHSNLANFRPPGISGHSYSNNPYRSSSTHRNNEYLPASATRKNFDIVHTSTARSFFLQPIKSPSNHYYTHTEKPKQSQQLPVPVLPTLSPIVFSSPTPFSLSRNIENIKRFTDNNDDDHDLPPRIIISASASVSDASGRTLNYSLGTIGAAKILAQPPSSYDDYKEHDVVLDPFYHDVPKIKNKRGKREATPNKSKRAPQSVNPLDVIQSEDEAIEVLKFLFDWYKNHEKTTAKPTTINIPVSPEVITNINNEFSSKPVDYQLQPITERTLFHNVPGSREQQNVGQHGFRQNIQHSAVPNEQSHDFGHNKLHDSTPSAHSFGHNRQHDSIQFEQRGFSRNRHDFGQNSPHGFSQNRQHDFTQNRQDGLSQNKRARNRGRHRFTPPFVSTERHTAAEFYSINYDLLTPKNMPSTTTTTTTSTTSPPAQHSVNPKTPSGHIIENYVSKSEAPTTQRVESRNADYFSDDLEFNQQETQKTSSQIVQKPTEGYGQIDTYDYVDDNYEPNTYSNSNSKESNETIYPIHKDIINEETYINIEQTTTNSPKPFEVSQESHPKEDYRAVEATTIYENVQETRPREDSKTVGTTFNYDYLDENIWPTTPSPFKEYENNQNKKNVEETIFPTTQSSHKEYQNEPIKENFEETVFPTTPSFQKEYENEPINKNLEGTIFPTTPSFQKEYENGPIKENKTEITNQEIWNTETVPTITELPTTHNFETTTIPSTIQTPATYEEKYSNKIENEELTTMLPTNNFDETTNKNYEDYHQLYTSKTLEKIEGKPIIKSINDEDFQQSHIPFGIEYTETTPAPKTTPSTINTQLPESSTRTRTRGRLRSYEFTSREATTTPISTRKWYNSRRRGSARRKQFQDLYEPYPEITTPTSFFITKPPFTKYETNTSPSSSQVSEEQTENSTSPTIIFIVKPKENNASAENTVAYDTTLDVTTPSSQSPSFRDINRIFDTLEYDSTTPPSEEEITNPITTTEIYSETSTAATTNVETTTRTNTETIAYVNTETTAKTNTESSTNTNTEITSSTTVQTNPTSDEFIRDIEQTTNSLELTRYSKEKIDEMIKTIEKNTNSEAVSSVTEEIEETSTINPTTILESSTITQQTDEVPTTTTTASSVPKSTSPLTLIEVNTRITEGNSNENELNYNKNDEFKLYREGRLHSNRQRLPKKSKPTQGFKKFSSRHRFSSTANQKISSTTSTEQSTTSTSTTQSTMLYKVQLRKEKVNKQYIFNCFGKPLNQFYSDPRDCRLFHYCTVGYTKNQLLDMKFVCDLGTHFDDEKLVCTKEKPTRCL